MPLCDRLYTAAPDFRQKRSSPQDERHACGKPGWNIDSEEAEAEKGDEKLHQERRALKDFDIDAGKTAQGRTRTDAQPQKREADQASANVKQAGDKAKDAVDDVKDAFK